MDFGFVVAEASRVRYDPSSTQKTAQLADVLNACIDHCLDRVETANRRISTFTLLNGCCHNKPAVLARARAGFGRAFHSMKFVMVVVLVPQQ
jgi:hypothetical protein